MENYYNYIPKMRYCTYTMIKPYKLPSLNYCAGPIPQLHNQDHAT